MSDFLTRFHHHAGKRKILFIAVLSLLILLSMFSVSRIKLKEDISAIIPRDDRVSRISDVLMNAKLADQIILTISHLEDSSADPKQLIDAGNHLYELLLADSTHVKGVRFRNDDEAFLHVYDFIYAYLPLYLTENEYLIIEEKLHPDSIARSMQANFTSLASLAGILTKDFIFKDPLSITPLALKQLESFQLDDNFTLYGSCVFTKDLQNLLLFIEPRFPSSNTKENAALIKRLNLSIENTLGVYDAVKMEYYGGTAVAVSNAQIIKKDIKLTVTVACVALLLLFVLIFRRARHIILIFIPIILGMLFALGIFVKFQPEISAISLGIGAILVGISLDYSLHLFTHYRNDGSLKNSLKSVRLPIIMSCLSTASAFLCLFVVRSEALNQLGLFAALAIVCTAVVVLFIIPFFMRENISTEGEKHSLGKNLLDYLASISLDTKPYLVYIILIMSILFYFSSKHLGFNSDLSTLNYLSPELRTAERNLKAISAEASSAVYLATQGDSYEEALEKSWRNQGQLDEALADDVIFSYTSPHMLIPGKETQTARIERWNRFWEGMDIERLKIIMEEAAQANQFREGAFNAFFKQLDKEYQVVTPDVFDPLRDVFLTNFLAEGEGNYYAITVVKTDQRNKVELFSRFANNEDIIITDNLFFIHQFLDVLKDDFRLLVLISIILVFCILLFFFGRIEIAIITFIPIMLSWLWTVGIMGLFGIQFNIINIIVSTFILGLGVDYSIFIMSGLIKNYTYGTQNLNPYRLSVLLSALTTVIALGVLIFAKHPALKSIASVSIVGIVSVLFITYTILPIMFRFIVSNKGKPRMQPVTFSTFLISVSTLLIFVVGSLSITLLLPLIMILPARRRFKKRIVHHLIRLSSWFIVYINFTFKKNYINKGKLDFSSPVVLVSNHQSHLDLVLILLLNPRIIALTNSWVWNSPYFGSVIRYAGFYPAFKGLDFAIDRIAQKVSEGYSVLVFPEGGRSKDGKIGRMHQGAFHLAAALNIDIQPIVVHGIYQTLKKDEFFLRPGKVTLAFYDRIKVQPVRLDHNETYRAQAKDLTQFYRKEFDAYRKEIETPAYFRRHVTAQYLYKGPVLEWYLKVKLRLENNYSRIHELVPVHGSILDIGCGYGFLAYMLGFLSEGRTIKGVDYDERKIRLANHCAAKSERIRFYCEDVFHFDITPHDVFILSDVLHYFNEEKQLALIARCLENLNPGGIMIIRDADSHLAKRHVITRLTEFFSTKTGFNKMGEGRLFFSSADTIRQLVDGFKLSMETIDNDGLTSNVMHIIRK